MQVSKIGTHAVGAGVGADVVGAPVGNSVGADVGGGIHPGIGVAPHVQMRLLQKHIGSL